MNAWFDFEITWQEYSLKAKNVQSATFSHVGSRAQIKVKGLSFFNLIGFWYSLYKGDGHMETNATPSRVGPRSRSQMEVKGQLWQLLICSIHNDKGERGRCIMFFHEKQPSSCFLGHKDPGQRSLGWLIQKICLYSTLNAVEEIYYKLCMYVFWGNKISRVAFWVNMVMVKVSIAWNRKLMLSNQLAYCYRHWLLYLVYIMLVA